MTDPKVRRLLGMIDKLAEDVRKPPRWCVVVSSIGKYVGEDGKLEWTTDLEQAKRIAAQVGGEVVDADWFAANYDLWQKDFVIPPDAKPEEHR